MDFFTVISQEWTNFLTDSAVKTLILLESSLKLQPLETTTQLFVIINSHRCAYSYTQYHICLPYLGQTKSTCRSISTQFVFNSTSAHRILAIFFNHFQNIKNVSLVFHTRTLFVEQSIAHTAIFRSPCNIFGSHK